MAGCSPSGQYSLGSAEDFDFVCSLCTKKNATKEAECYCKVCCQYFCITCKDFHGNLMPHHTAWLIAKAELDKHGVLPAGPALTNTCERHTEKLIELFSGERKLVGCCVCMAIDHNDFGPRTVVLQRASNGYGFVLRGAKSKLKQHGDLDFRPTSEFPALQYIENVDPGSASDRAGLKAGDFILEINGENVVRAPHERVVHLIRGTGNTLVMKVVTVEPSARSPD